ncbi:manganese-dependent ADP-ribose/CDP-alcohol diphosphatase-like [Primulina huaijiensis]|uniref:manganese-dependent ADP-ribose/CDP-alcohol diphosphatase-like n=1 Tax=Primulina huaijiensis TaxID=1492673 RepID=UPI003CC6EF44
MGCANGVVSARRRQPPVSFGVISDVQYADIPDRRSFQAIAGIACLCCKEHICPKDRSLTAVDKIVNELSIFNGPVYHKIGNHRLYNLPCEKLRADGVVGSYPSRCNNVKPESYYMLPSTFGSSSNEALLWNYKEVMDLIHRYKCVKISVAGHDHKGGYCIDSHGVHHRVLEAALKCPPSSDSFGYIDLFHDRLFTLWFRQNGNDGYGFQLDRQKNIYL